MMASEVPLAKVLERFGGKVELDETATDMPCLLVPPEDLVELCLFLRDDAELQFNFLSDICGVDFHPEIPRFMLVYHLVSIPNHWRLRLKCRLFDPPAAPTITPVWTTANWHEREAYDMYGIIFDGHPDLRRLYMWDEFDGFPMRRDFPLRGYKDNYNPLGATRRDGGGGA
ncbi:NADH-quinone oxidoreductase subunit C [Leisingera sp. ANG59]|uniref:NADH-quinone oxidoreductase subunit C n=1 Tax=Leisingera sp. ANG59 TaxID=2675221 RepID=UPI001C2D45F6|nr:NADH-quinone oxidoreductase subunit C [Leisingera sp. ANG59]